MEEFLRDSIWQGIAGIFGIITFAFGAIIFFLQRKIKSLVYEVPASTSLITLDEEIKGKIKILFNDIPVQNVHLLILRIVNNGNESVPSSDFESPLNFNFGEKTKILSSEILKVENQTLNPKFNIRTNEIELNPLLLNKKDSIEIKLLLAQFEGEIQVGGRINGVEEVRRVKEVRYVPTKKEIILSFAWLFWVLMLMVAAILIVSWFPLLRTSLASSDIVSSIWGYVYVIVSAFLIGLVWGQIQKIRSQMQGSNRSQLHQKG